MEQTLRELEFRLLDHDIRTSRERLSALLDEGFVEIGSAGRMWTREEVIARLADEEPSEWSVSRFEVRDLGSGAAIVTYAATRMERDGSMRRTMRSSIWCRRADGWRLVFHQGTPMD